jgi:hypothetical protein
VERAQLEMQLVVARVVADAELASTYDVSTSFNVVDLSPFFVLEESRMTPFQGGRMI